MSARRPELLRIGEIARRSGVGRGTIQHYLREGLLPKPVKTYRNMAYYDPICIERIKLVKELQDSTYLPLSEIRKLVGEERDGDLARALLDAQQAALRAISPPARTGSMTREGAAKAFDLDLELIHELIELGVVSEHDGALTGVDLDVLAAITNLKQLGFTREAGFRAEDLSMYKQALDGLLHQEVRSFLGVVAGGRAERSAPELARSAVDAATMLILALRKKTVLDFLQAAGAELAGDSGGR